MIIVDTREKGIEAILFALRRNQIPVSRQVLDYCDYALIGGRQTIGVERKRIPDLLQSLPDLDSKFHHMRKEYDVVALLVEGSPEVEYHTGRVVLQRGAELHYSRVQAGDLATFLFSFQMKGGVLITTNGAEHTGLTLVSLYERMKRSWKPTFRVEPCNLSPEDWAQHRLELIKGIGPTLAARIVDVASSVEGMGLNRLKALKAELKGDKHHASSSKRA